MSFIYLGHGVELVSDTGDLLMKEVPPKCTLSTIAESGVGSDLRSILNLCNVAEEHPEMLQDPYEHRNALNRKFTGRLYDNKFQHKEVLVKGAFHITLPGKQFTEKYCDFLQVYPNPGKPNEVIIFRSGLYDLSKITEPLPRLTGGNIYDTSSYTIDKTNGVTKELVERVYQDSIYPRANDICKIIICLTEYSERPLKETYYDKSIHFDTIVMKEPIPYNIFTRAVRIASAFNLHELMTRLQGHHFFFSCRTYQKDILRFNQVQAIRGHSHNRAAAMFNELSPVDIKGSVKGRHNFKLYLRHLTSQHPILKDRIAQNDYDYYIEHLIGRINYCKTKGPLTPFRYVNALIEEINNGLRDKLFTANDIDSRILPYILKVNEVNDEIVKLEV